MVIIKGGIKMDWRNQRLYLKDNEKDNEKDVEEMTNEEFAKHLLSVINSETVYKKNPIRSVYYRGEMVYKVDNDNVNFRKWNHGLLHSKFSFCDFDGYGIVMSKGNRKKFVSIVKQVIWYFENLEIKLGDESE